MRPLVIAAILVLMFAASVFAQTSVTAQTVGDFTYYSGTVDGERLSGISQRIGDYTTGDGFSATTQRIGSSSYLEADEDG